MGALCAVAFAALFLYLPKLIKKKKKKEDFKVELIVCIAAIAGMIIFGALSPEVESIEETSGTQQQEVVEEVEAE